MNKPRKLHDSEELIIASKYGSAQKLEDILKTAANPNYKDKDNWTALGKAVSDFANTKKVKILLDYGADVNQTSGSAEQTPIAIAIGAENTLIYAMLLDNGADINIPNRHNWFPIMSLALNTNMDTDTLELFKDAKPSKASLDRALEIAKNNNNKTFLEVFSK
jgi:ankyrin repeat protein